MTPEEIANIIGEIRTNNGMAFQNKYYDIPKEPEDETENLPEESVEIPGIVDDEVKKILMERRFIETAPKRVPLRSSSRGIPNQIPHGRLPIGAGIFLVTNSAPAPTRKLVSQPVVEQRVKSGRVLDL